MRALALSDTHFGAWTGDDLLSHPFALERLAPHLDEIDELILLGDLFDFLFSTVEHAVVQAQGFLDLVAGRLRGKRVVFLAGNHDHHTMVRELEESVRLRIADGVDAETAGRQAREDDWLGRYLERRMPGVEVEIAYPTYWVGRVLLFHGHYLDAHMEGSLSNRMLTRTIWKVAGGRPADRLTIEDYESVIVPLTEMLYAVAQLPHGTAAQQSVYDQIGRLGRLSCRPAQSQPAREDSRRSAPRRCGPAAANGRESLQLASQASLGLPSIAEGLVVDHDSRRKEEPAAERQFLALGRSEIKGHDLDLEFLGEALEHPLGVVAESTVLPGQEHDPESACLRSHPSSPDGCPPAGWGPGGTWCSSERRHNPRANGSVRPVPPGRRCARRRRCPSSRSCWHCSCVRPAARDRRAPGW